MFRRIFLALTVLGFMLGILWGLSHIEGSLYNTDYERNFAETRQRLILDSKIVKKSSLAEVHTGILLFRKLSRLSSDGITLNEYFARAASLLQRFFSQFDHQPAWHFYEFCDQQKDTYISQDLQLTLSGGKQLEFSPANFELLLFKGISSLSNKPMSQQLQLNLRQYAGEKLDNKTANDQSDFIRSTMASFKNVGIEKKDYVMAWFPLFKTHWPDSFTRFEKIQLEHFDKRDFNLANLHGIALVSFNKSDIDLIRYELVKKSISENLALNGCKVSFFPAKAMTSEQRKAAEQNAFIQKDEQHLITSLKVRLDKEYIVVLSRKMEGFSSLNTVQRSFAYAGKVIWFLCGLFFCIFIILLNKRISLNLTAQLMLFIAWMLFPAFFSAYCATERNVIEKQSAALSDLKIKLENLSRSFDQSLEIYKTWVCESIYNAVSDAAQQKGINFFYLSKDRADFVLKSLHQFLLKQGIFSKNIFMLNANGDVTSILAGAKRKEELVIQDFFKSFYLQSLTLDDEKKKAKKNGNLLAGAQNEEIIELAGTILPVESISAMAMKNESFEVLESFNEKAFIYHKYLGTKKNAGSVMHVGIYKPSLERICMLDWTENYSDPDMAGLEWLPIRGLSPSWFHRSPFWKANVTGKMGLLSPVFDFLPPELVFFSHVSREFRESFTTPVVLRGEKCLFSCMPGINMGDYTIGLLLPLKSHFEKIENFRNRLQLAMGLIFFVCSFIGGWLAKSFIKPIKSLAENAIKITRGDFKARLNKEWEDQEIQELAQNFNQVAQNLEEGKNLKKFVSATTLESLQHSSDFQKEPQAIKAVVLFIRLDKFWEKAVEITPEKSVNILNDFFSLVCKRVKAAGGDVSKFIGEKVMVVFEINGRSDQDTVVKKVANFTVELRSVERQISALLNGTRLRIGVAAGEVLSGIIGGDDTRLENTVIGDKVNLAARLCSYETKKPVMLDEEFAKMLLSTIEAGQGNFCVRKLPDAKIKGKKDMVCVYSLEKAVENIN
jgi:class 3 adenylate cyclase